MFDARLLRWPTTLFFMVVGVGCAFGGESSQERIYRFQALDVACGGTNGFALVSPEFSGVRFTNILTKTHAMINMNLANGSGVGLGDYDGDGRCDIYLCSLDEPNQLYRNLGGMRFQDVTAQAGVACPDRLSTGAVFEDVNGDGRLDLIVTSMGGPNALFINQGNGKFKDQSQTAGLESTYGSSSIALADADGDGDLDLYICNYGATSILRSGGALNISRRNGKYVVRGRYAKRIKIIGDTMFELGEPDYFYLNDGSGRFELQSWTDGRFLDAQGRPYDEPPMDQGLTVCFRDINQDGAPDLYVCNDAFTPDRFYLNNGSGKFREIDPLAIRKTCYFTMGADVADINRDGFYDLLAVDMLSTDHTLRLTQKSERVEDEQTIGVFDNRSQVRRNTLQLSRGDGTYAEIANFSHIAASDWTWSALFLDVDLDGWEDLMIPNGFIWNVDDIDTRLEIKSLGPMSVAESRRTNLMYPPLRTPNQAFRNLGNLRFKSVNHQWGFDSLDISNGMALADLDDDGDLDAVVNAMNAPAKIYENLTSAPRLAIRLHGSAPNTRGIGAQIRVLGGPQPQLQEMISGGRYVSGDDAMRVFAAGSLTNRLTIEVTWRDGSLSRIPEARPNRLYVIRQNKAQPSPNPRPAPAKTWFVDRSSQLGHQHHESPFDDFQQQPLLPRRLSQMGPGVAIWDLNQDELDDIVIGSGRGGAPAAFMNQANFDWTRKSNDFPPAQDDYTGFAGWTRADGTTGLVFGENAYENTESNPPPLHFLFWKNDSLRWENLGPLGPAGALAVADIDHDGDLDLFAAGGPVPGRYPNSTPNRIFRQNPDGLLLDESNTHALQTVGTVNGATFADLNNDSFPDLILACEWGPVRVFQNHQGTLRESTRELGLMTWTGWWQGVATGDFNNDGRLDLVASNWGLNDIYQPSPANPIHLITHPNPTGNWNLIEAYHHPQTHQLVPRRDFFALSTAIPEITRKFNQHRDYAQATIQEILGPPADTAKQFQANTLTTMVWLNQEAQFIPAKLPPQTQFAPAFAPVVNDFNGDGYEDIFLSQNFFATRSGHPRLDAGRGLLLIGNGQGEFTAVPGQTSGIRIYGEQRAAAAADLDHDGRVDLLVSQNGTHTILLRNQQAQPGLQVHLQGPPANPYAIGAQVQLQFPTTQGPVREVQSGSTFWSQSSPTQILGGAAQASTLLVRWPNGKSQSYPISDPTKPLHLTSPNN